MARFGFQRFQLFADLKQISPETEEYFEAKYQLYYNKVIEM